MNDSLYEFMIDIKFEWFHYYFISDMLLWNDQIKTLRMIRLNASLWDWLEFINGILITKADDHGETGICLLVLTPCSRHFFLGDIESHVLLDSLRQTWVAVESQLSRSWVAVESQLSRSWVAVPDVVANCDSDSPISLRVSQLRSERDSRVWDWGCSKR